MLRHKLPLLLIVLAVAAPVVADAGPQYLFVQNAAAIRVDGNTLTLKGAARLTLFFSDRPVRIAGHMSTQEFVDRWGEGDDSFASDPPNAALSIQDDETISDVVVELSNPRIQGKNLIYDVKVLEGELPAKGGPSALFIDIIGMPFTPLSVAGVERRTMRRAVIYGGAAMVASEPVYVQSAPPAPAPDTYPAPAPAPAAAAAAAASPEDQLKTLKSLLDQGLITKGEYDKKTAEIVELM